MQEICDPQQFPYKHITKAFWKHKIRELNSKQISGKGIIDHFQQEYNKFIQSTINYREKNNDLK